MGIVKLRGSGAALCNELFRFFASSIVCFTAGNTALTTDASTLAMRKMVAQ